MLSQSVRQLFRPDGLPLLRSLSDLSTDPSTNRQTNMQLTIKSVRAYPLAFVFAALIACSSSTGPDTSYVGAYTLLNANGSTLPATTFLGNGEKDELLSGGGSINADGTYSFSLNFRITVGATVTSLPTGSVGTWVRTNNAFSFRDNSDGSTITGAYSNGQMTLVDTGVSLVFRHT